MPRPQSLRASVAGGSSSPTVETRSLIPMKDSKKRWYQLKDSETKWYHHLMHGRVLIMLVLMVIVYLFAIAIGIYILFGR
jgi:hypothetical protein